MMDRKALITLLALVVLLVFLVFIVCRFVKRINHKDRAASVGTCLEILVVLGLVSFLIPYSWPFPINVRLTECAELTALEEIDLPEDTSWYCVYHIPIIGEWWEDSYWGVPIVKVAGGYPEFEFDKYTYLFSFERKVESLSYYVWDNRGQEIIDLGTANKWGTAVLSDEKFENKIFVYRFPRVAVDNINDTKYKSIVSSVTFR